MDLITQKLGTKVVVKPDRAGSSIGVRKCESAEEIEKAIASAKESTPKLLHEFYSKFHGKNKLLIHAKTCNSAFDFLSTLILVPGLIIGLTDYCKHMTEKRKAEENRIKNQIQAQQAPLVPSSKPTMQGFLNREVA